MYYIGVDLGTSAVKLLLMEADGTIRNVVSKEYPLYFPIRAGQNRSRRTGGTLWWKVSRSWCRKKLGKKWPA